MFHPDKIEQKIHKASQRMTYTSLRDSSGRALFPEGFRLQRHSISQVAQANASLEANILEIKKNIPVLRHPWTWEEIRWMRNEKRLCQCDFLYWATRYGFIIDWKEQLVRFNPNIAQQMALDTFAQLEIMDVAILVQALKARQLGITTITELIILWKTIFFPRTNSLVASSDPDKSALMAQKMEICFENQPFWLQPVISGYHKGELIEFIGQNSAITIQHGTQMSGLARGSTPTTFHLSEVCDYRNPEELIDAALLRAVHDSPWVFGVLESTASGIGNYWHDKWLYNVANWPIHQSRLCPMFLPWYVGTDLYPTPTWIKGHPVPRDGRFEDLTVKHAGRAKDYVQSGNNPLVTKFLGNKWEMSPEQMWFWQITRKEYQAMRRLNDFYAELCADETEAFQSSNTSVFDAEIISSYRESRRKPVAVYGILAPQAEIPIILQPREADIDRNSPYIDIEANWAQNQPKHNYRLVPLLHRGSAEFDPQGKIIMYEPPENQEIYAQGVDTGYGLDQDSSVLEVVRKGTLDKNDCQVCEYASAKAPASSLWPIALALGTLYSTVVNGQRKQCKQVIEMAANGEIVQNELKKRGWRNFHLWVRYDRKRIMEGQATRLGWFTVPWSRAMMLDMLMDALNNGWLDINSQWFINEMATLELDMASQKIKAGGKAHDDRIMALGIALFSMHALETRHADRWVTRERMQRRDPNPIYAKYSAGAQGSDWSDLVRDATTSYNYRVIRPGDSDFSEFQSSGAQIWTPGKQ